MRKMLVPLILGLVGLLGWPWGGSPGGEPRAGPKGDRSPAVGEPAPDFEMVRLDAYLKAGEKPPAEKTGAKESAGKPEKKDGPAAGQPAAEQKPAEPAKVKLSSFRGKRPVVVVFSSYT